MNDLIRDTLSQLTKVTLKDGEMTIFFHPKSNRQLFIDFVMFHLRDADRNEYGHSSILLSENYRIGLRSVSFKPKEWNGIEKAKNIFFYVHDRNSVKGIPFPIER